MQPHQTIARWLINGSWVALIALLTLYFADKEGKQFNPNQRLASTIEGGTREVRLNANYHHHYVANGSLNHTPVTFMIDTGATDVAIPAHLGKKLGLIPGEQGISTTANGDVTVYRTRINSIELGNIVIGDLQGSLNPGMTSDEILLGMSFLKHLEFSQVDGVLALRQK